MNAHIIADAPAQHVLVLKFKDRAAAQAHNDSATCKHARCATVPAVST